MATKSALSPQLVHPWLRWPLRLYKGLLLFVLLALLGNFAVVPLAEGTSDWPVAALGQIAALLALIRAHPLWTALVAFALVILFGASLIADREAQREQAAVYEAHTVELSEQATVAQLERVLPGVARLIAQQVVGQVMSPDAEGLSARVAEQVAASIYAQLHSWAGALEDTSTATPIPLTVSGPSSRPEVPRIDIFVDRERELADLIGRVRTRGATDAVAVVGLPGVGKTALVAEAATQLSRDVASFPGGVAWVWCRAVPGVQGLSEIWTGIARALGLGRQLADPDAARAAVLAALHNPGRPRSILVLDEIAPGLVESGVLDALVGGRASIVVTARHEIPHPHVAVMRLETLEVPAGTELFVRCLRKIDSGRPTSDDMADIGALVRLLDGHPLAVSLAAQFAGTEHQTVSGLLASLREAVSPRTVLDRSWQSLTRPQQVLLAGLSLKDSPSIPWATARAIAHAARLAEGDGTKGDGTIGTAEDDMHALVRASLVDAESGAWLRLHPVVREYATARLAELPENVRALLREAAAN